MDRPIDPELTRGQERRHRVGLARQQPELGADPRPGHGSQGALSDRLARQRQRPRLDLEPQPASVPGQPQQPCRVVDEAFVVQHPEQPGVEVLKRLGRGPQPARVAPRQRDGYRVDREVAPAQILVDARRAHIR